MHSYNSFFTLLTWYIIYLSSGTLLHCGQYFQVLLATDLYMFMCDCCIHYYCRQSKNHKLEELHLCRHPFLVLNTVCHLGTSSLSNAHVWRPTIHCALVGSSYTSSHLGTFILDVITRCRTSLHSCRTHLSDRSHLCAFSSDFCIHSSEVYELRGFMHWFTACDPIPGVPVLDIFSSSIQLAYNICCFHYPQGAIHT